MAKKVGRPRALDETKQREIYAVESRSASAGTDLATAAGGRLHPRETAEEKLASKVSN